MLLQLDIKNYAFIESATLEFKEGMTVITGESGSGKSMLLGGLELCFGKRAESSMVGPFHDKCEVSLLFDTKNYPFISAWLSEKDLAWDEEHILIRRQIDKEGRSKAYINDHLASLQSLKELSSLIVNLHGQHENQALLKKEYQRSVLDSFAQLETLSQSLNQQVNQWKNIQKEIQSLQAAEDNAATKTLLEYQLKELKELNLLPNELEELEQQHQTLANIDTITQVCQQSIHLLSEQDPSLLQTLSRMQDNLASLTKHPDLEQSSLCIENAIIQLSEAERSLTHYLNQLTLDPEKYQQIDKRLTHIYDLARKHKVQAKGLYTHIQNLEQTLTTLKGAEEAIAKLLQQLQAIERIYAKIANELSQKRKEASNKFDKEITRKMKLLGITQGHFLTTFTPFEDSKPRLYGQEAVEFFVATNPQQIPGPLNKIISGGELSRISLAIQSSTAENLLVPCLIFDEVDVGISGGIAEVLGGLLRDLSKSAQIICITHLPQVASMAHHHITVEKSLSNKQTKILFKNLNFEQRIQEIARMLGGLTLTKQTLKLAKEMLEHSQTVA